MSLTVEYQWRGDFDSADLERLHAAGFEREPAWLHVDFDDHLRSLYFDRCGFEPTNAGLIAL